MIDINIQIVGVEEISEMKRIFFAKFASDRFKVSWHTYKESDKVYDENISKIRKNHNFKILSVAFEYDEEQTVEREMRKNPIEIEKKVEQSL